MYIKDLLWNIIRIHFLFPVLSQTSKQLLSNFQPQKPSNYKQIWRLRPDPSCVCKKCTLIIKCFSHAKCHLELTSISKTITAFSKSANNFRRGNNIYFLKIVMFNLELCFIIVIILLLKVFTTLKYVNYNNSRWRQRKPYSLIYILTTFFYVAEFESLSK